MTIKDSFRNFLYGLVAASISSGTHPSRLHTGTGLRAAVAAPDAPLPGVVPLGPSGLDVYRVGGNCTTVWKPDTSGTWKEVNIQLMTGPNSPMIHITTVYQFDGTDQSLTNLSYPCPEVVPNSAIYFYQFSTPAAPQNVTWTTRFTIAAADGSTTPPANQTQPSGEAIPWGTGALVDPSKAVPPPTYLGQPNPPSTNTTTTTNSTTTTTTTTGGNQTSSSSDPASTPSSTQQQTVINTVTSTATDNGPAPTGGTTGGGVVRAQASFAVGAVAMSLIAVGFGVLS